MRARCWCIAVLTVPLAWSALSTHAVAQNGSGFFRAEGKEIVDPAGNPVVPRGIGLGGWLMPEGYMLDISTPNGGSPSSIRTQIEALIGPVNTATFYELYEANYVDEKDIAAMASWGVDHLRLPFHYNRFYDAATGTFKEDGFALLDTFLGWCRTYNISVILDMHAAPGAQNTGPISDSDGVARLWTEPVPYQDQTVEIWTEIARRYVDEPLVMGYDLINEPVTPDGYFDDLWDLYARIAAAIRQVDTNHILFIEGNYYGTTFPAVAPFDDNMVYAFHKYWNGPDQGSIQYLIDLRNRDNVPLWLGETGENSNTWYWNVTRLMEQNGIGVNWWTHKQIEATAAPLSAPYAPGYQEVIDYWRGAGPRPSDRAASEALFAMARGLDLDSCEVRGGVIEAQFDLDVGFAHRPFKDHVIPGVINAADYNLGFQGSAYSDSDHSAVTGAPGGGNNGGTYRNDGVDIERSTDPEGFEYNVGWMETGEWIRYTVNVETAGVYDIDLRVASLTGGGRLRLKLDEKDLGDPIVVGGTGGWQSWTTVTLRGATLPAGEHLLRLVVEASGMNLNRMTFNLVSPVAVDEVEEVPQSVRLHDVYPNPFVDRLTVRFESPAGATVGLKMFDVLGREVFEESPRAFAAGQHSIVAEIALGTGVYVMRLEIQEGGGQRYLSKKVVVGG
jgi:hypothetical protein